MAQGRVEEKYQGLGYSWSVPGHLGGFMGVYLASDKAENLGGQWNRAIKIRDSSIRQIWVLAMLTTLHHLGKIS